MILTAKKQIIGSITYIEIGIYANCIKMINHISGYNIFTSETIRAEWENIIFFPSLQYNTQIS